MPETIANWKAAAIRGLRTAVFTFFGVFIPSVLGFLTAVTDWATSNGAKDFPSTSAMVYAAASAAAAAGSGLISFLWNWLENSKGFALFGAKKDDQS